MVYAFDWLNQELDFIDRITHRRNRFNHTKNTATPALAAQAAALTRYWPNLQAGVVQALTLAGVNPTNPVAVLAATRTGQADNRDNAGTRPGQLVNADWVSRATGAAARGVAGAAESVTTAARATTRTAFTAMEGLAHEAVSRPIMAGAAASNFWEAGQPGYKGFFEAYREQPSSTLTHALHSLANGQGVELGSGFFADPESRDAKRYHRQVAGNRLQGGVHATPARSIFEDLGVNAIVEPGSRPYGLLTGLVDLGLAAKLDPSAAVLGAASTAKQAERTFGAALNDAGGITGWARKTVDPHTAANDWLNTNRVAGRAVQWLADTDDFTSIWNALGRRNVPRDVVHHLREATDTTQVRDILRDNLTTHMRVKPTARATNRRMGQAVGALFDLESAALSRVTDSGRFARPESAREIGELFGVGAAVRHGMGGQRAFGMLPKTYLDMTDLDGAQETLYRAAQTAKLPDDVARGFMTRFSQIRPDDLDSRAKATEIVRDFHAEVGGRLTTRGVAHDLSRRATRMFDEFEEDLRVYYQQYGDDVLFEGSKRRTMTIDGRDVAEARPSAQLLTEQAKTVPLFDDLTEFRRVTGIAEQLAGSRGKSLWDPNSVHGAAIRMTANGWSALMARWGQAQLARLAWPVRVIMEEHARMAADGLDSAYRHPIRWLQWAMTHDPESTVGKGVQSIARRVGVEGVNPVDVMGDATNLAVQRHMAANQAAAREWAGVKGRTGVSGDYVTWRKADGNKAYSKAWAGELSQLWSDPIASRLAGGLREGDTLGDGITATGNHIEDVHRWLIKGNGRRHLEQLATNDRMRHLASDPDAVMRYLAGGIDPTDGAELQGVWQRIHYQTGGNQELIAAIGQGRLDGHDLRGLTYDRKRVYQALDSRLDSAPEAVKAPIGLDNPQTGATLDRAVDRVFEHLFSMPDNVLSRLPAYDQNYWRRITELTSVMDEATGRAAVAGARNANIPRNLRRQLEARVSAGDGSITSLEVADLLAKDHALAATKKLLYDVSERSNFAEGTRFVTAFAEAWKEIATTWGRKVQESPQIVRRGQQIVESARESDPTDLLPAALGGDGDPSTGDGFFFRDPTTDREMFAYPGLGVLAHKLIGLPGDPTDMQQTASAQGLNLFAASVLPGLGPVATLAVGELLPDKPEWDAVRSAVLPFGGEDIDSAGEIVETLAPAWLGKMFSAWFGPRNETGDRTWAATVGDVAGYLAANDPSYYDDNGMLDQPRLAADAKAKAKDLMVLRGIAQFSLPTGPAAEFSIRDTDGKAWMMAALGDELRRLQYGDDAAGVAGMGHAAGLAEFLDRFGVDVLTAVEGRTSEIRKRALSKPGAAWERAHPDTAERWRDVIGFFAPESPDDFDIDAYSRQMQAGDRVALTTDQRLKSVNATMGQVILNRAADEITQAGLTADDQVAKDYMAFTRRWLDDTYPGWNERPGVGGRLSTDARIELIEQAVADDPTIAATEAGKATKLYLDARRQALEAVPTLSPTAKHYNQAKAAAPLRAWLRTVGEQLAIDYPEFRPMWEQVFLQDGRMSLERDYQPEELEVSTQ